MLRVLMDSFGMHWARLGGFLLVLAGCHGNTLQTEPAPTAPLVGDTLCMAGVAGYSTMTDPLLLQAQIARFQQLGVKTIRYDMDWMTIEKTPGVYDMDWIEAPLEALEAAGIKSIPILDYGNTLYNGETSEDYPTPPAPYAAWAAALAQRFGTRFSEYEIWNEENAGYRFWLPKEDPVAYAALLHAANASIKAACPACKVLFGGVDWLPIIITGAVPFLEAAFISDPSLRTSLDGVAVHPYSAYPPSTPPDSIVPPEVPLVNMMTEASTATGAMPALPEWITEVGWPTYPGVTDDPSQAAYLVMTYAFANKVGSRTVCWYTLQDGSDPLSFPPEQAFGILNYDPGGPATGTPKPAFLAMQAVSEWLGPTGFSRDRGAELGLAATGEAALFFRDPAATRGVTILWNENEPRGTPVKVPLHGSVAVQVFDTTGQAASFTSESGTVTVSVSTSPIFLVEAAE